MMVKNGTRACCDYEIHGSVIAIIDLCRGKSVTNDAEHVLADLAKAGFDLTRYRVIYRDTRGIWDELILRDGAFAGFLAINERDLETALAKLRRRRSEL